MDTLFTDTVSGTLYVLSRNLPLFIPTTPVNITGTIYHNTAFHYSFQLCHRHLRCYEPRAFMYLPWFNQAVEPEEALCLYIVPCIHFHVLIGVVNKDNFLYHFSCYVAAIQMQIYLFVCSTHCVSFSLHQVG